ncbi:MAG: tetratricopeptide repeat protein [Myxococcota bacterium]
MHWKNLETISPTFPIGGLLTNSGKAQFAALIQEAMDLRNAGSLLESLELLKYLVQRVPRQKTVVGLLALVLQDLDRTEEAARYFKLSTELSPDSEISSLGLFHCLLSLGNLDEAFDEMRRFLANNESEEYLLLLKELNGESPR